MVCVCVCVKDRTNRVCVCLCERKKEGEVGKTRKAMKKNTLIKIVIMHNM